MKTRIIDELAKMEQEYDIEIILAVESGSRAWGFYSEDSDYDVRFIYKQKTAEYLKIVPSSSVISIPIYDDLDFHGWDVKKALFLLHKSNPSLLEWVNSPIVYVENKDCEKLRKLATTYFDAKTAILHYLSYAKLDTKESKITLKKYLYSIRGLLCAYYISKYKKPAPVLFEELLFLIEDIEIRSQILNLVQIKKGMKEKDTFSRIESIDVYLETIFNDINSEVKEYEKHSPTFDELDAYFREVIGIK